MKRSFIVVIAGLLGQLVRRGCCQWQGQVKRSLTSSSILG